MTSVIQDEGKTAAVGSASSVAPYLLIGLFVLLILFAIGFMPGPVGATLRGLGASVLSPAEALIRGVLNIGAALVNYVFNLANGAYNWAKGVGTGITKSIHLLIEVG